MTMSATTEHRLSNRGLRILCPNGHMGFAPTKLGSFNIGLAAEPDMIAGDSGSCDCGPVPLGGGRKLSVPMLIGSAGDTGTNSRVDRYIDIVQNLAREHRIPRFKLGYFYSEQTRDTIRARMGAGDTVRGLDGRPDLTESELDATDRIVAVAGVHPFIKLLDMGADVIIGGRSSDCAIFAAPAIRAGYPQALAYFYGKVMECASFCAEPYGAKESIIGEITMEDVKVTAMLPEQRCTIASVAGHSMYERSNPYYEYFLGGHIDMSECVYEQFDERTTRVTGPRFVPADELRVKLEGAGKVGERYVGMVGIRDPYTISRIDEVIAWAKGQVRERFGETGYQLSYTVYGRDGILGEMEPMRDKPAHEVCIVVQGVAPTKEMAEEVCMIGTRQMFYARLPNVKGTAGGVAFMLDEVMPASAAYRWTMNHTMRVNDPLELFPVHMIEAGV
jgi:hypothetical protein